MNEKITSNLYEIIIDDSGFSKLVKERFIPLFYFLIFIK